MSGTIIKLKYSDVTAQPASDALAVAEPAYSFNSDVLFIGKDNGGTIDPIVIGGKKFTDMLDHTAGILTASSAIVVDSNKHVDELITGGLTLTTSGGTGQQVTSIVTSIGVSPADTELATAQAVKEYVDNIVVNVSLNELDDVAYLTTPANGEVIVYNATSGEWENKAFSGDATLAVDGALTLADTGVTAGTVGSTTEIPVLTIDSKGRITSTTTATISTTFTIAADSGANDTFNTGETFTIAGGTALTTTVTDNQISVALDDTAVTAGSYGSATEIPTFTVDAQGRLTAAGTASISTSLDIAGDSGTDTIALGTDTLTFSGTNGISTSVATDEVTITVDTATTTTKGVASFNTNDFTVTNGAVSIGSLSNDQLDNSDVTIGSTTVSLGGTSTTLAGLTEVDIDNLNINGNEISSTDANGDISLNPNGTGNVAVNGAKITGLAEPTASNDAATKNYVDAAVEGLAVKPAVKAATTEDLGGTYNNGTAGVGSTLNLGPSVSLTIDDVSITDLYDGILVKDQTNAYENGRYFVSQVGNGSTDWILTRCGKCDEPAEIPSMYVFVQEGTLYNSTGWVATVDTLPMTVGTDDIVFTQFSGAGTYTAGNGLTLTGTEFAVDTGDGIQISDNAVSANVGDGLTISLGEIVVDLDPLGYIVSNGGSLAVDTASLFGSTITLFGGAYDVNTGAGLQIGSLGDVEVNAGDGIDTSAGTVALASSVAGTNLTYAAGVISLDSTYAGQNTITTVGTITSGSWNGDKISVEYGGTGITSYTQGDILYADSANTLTVLGAGAEGEVLQVNASGEPEWGVIDGGTF